MTVKKSMLRSDVPKPSLYYTLENQMEPENYLFERNVIFQTCHFWAHRLRPAKTCNFQIWLGGNHPTPVIKTPLYILNIDSQLLQATGPVWENSTSNFSKIESNLSLQCGFYRRYFTRQLPFWPTVTSDRVLAANVDLSPNTGQWQAPSRHASGKVDPL